MQPKTLKTYRGVKPCVQTRVSETDGEGLPLPRRPQVGDSGLTVAPFEPPGRQASRSTCPTWARRMGHTARLPFRTGAGTCDGICRLEVRTPLAGGSSCLRRSRCCYLAASSPRRTSRRSFQSHIPHGGRFPRFDVPALEYGHINPMPTFEIEAEARAGGYQPSSTSR